MTLLSSIRSGWAARQDLVDGTASRVSASGGLDALLRG